MQEGKFVFRSYENGDYKHTEPISRHSNIVKGVIVGKKSWGLFVNEWSTDISKGFFTKSEILYEFDIRGIKIPESLLEDFDNKIYLKRKIHTDHYFSRSNYIKYTENTNDVLRKEMKGDYEKKFI